MKTVGKTLVVLAMLAAIGALGYALLAPHEAPGAQSEQPLPSAQAMRTTITKQVTGPGEVKPASTDKLKLPRWRYFKASPVALNERVAANTALVECTSGDPLLAPYDLVVLSKNLPKEKEELTDEHYVEVARVDAMHVEFDAHENDIAMLAKGQSVAVAIGSQGGAEVAGTVVGINQVGAYSATGSKYKVTVEIPNGGDLLIGMSANVKINVAEATDVIAVPVSAIVDGGRGVSTVLVQRADGVTEPVEVETGLSDGNLVEVKRGLAEGDTVILNEVDDGGADIGGGMAAGPLSIESVG